MRHYIVISLFVMCFSFTSFSYAKPPREVGEAINQSADLLDAGSYQQVIDHLSPVLERYPEQERLYKLRGLAYFSIKPADLDKAEADFNQVVTLNPLDEEAKLLVAKVREARDAQDSAWILMLFDKGMDLVLEILIIALGFTGGMLFNGYLKNLLWLRKTRKLYKEKKYDQYTDLLEHKLNETAYSEVRKTIERQYKATDHIELLENLGKNIINEDHKNMIYKMMMRIMDENDHHLINKHFNSI